VDFSSFPPASESEIHNILSNYPNKQPNSDPITTWLLEECASLTFPTITNIVNLSLASGQFHLIIKESVISPLLKKPALDKDQLSNYRPISNLSLISKIIERVIKSRLVDHLPTNYLILTNLLTETALSYIHDHLINVIGSHKVSCLVFSTFLAPLTPLIMTS